MKRLQSIFIIILLLFSFTACEETPESTQERGIKTERGGQPLFYLCEVLSITSS